MIMLVEIDEEHLMHSLTASWLLVIRKRVEQRSDTAKYNAEHWDHG